MNQNDVAQEIRRWLMETAHSGASDLHLVVGYPPIRREHGELILTDREPLTAETVLGALRSICAKSEFDKFTQQRNLDFALELDGNEHQQRFRVNLFYSGEQAGACIRVIPAEIPELQWANFPLQLANKIATFRNGLVVFAGVTGSGKTTSMALMINMLCNAGGLRVVTIEDPIEYRFTQSKSVVTQRELGSDVESFADGLKYALRQDPDVILVGEIRDQETARMASSAAETGHLVLTTLHTRDAKGAVTRFVDLFPKQNQSETCSVLAIGLRAVISQHLLPNIVPGQKRELALEVMFNSNPIAASIRQARFDSIDNAILTGRKDGMISLDESIKRLYQEGKISDATAERFISDRGLLRR